MNLDIKTTHLDRLIFPKEGYLKKDVLDYYDSISEFILPYLINRPQNMHRYVEDIYGMNFYHKDFEQKHPSFVSIYDVKREHPEDFPEKAGGFDTEVSYILCQNKETLLYLINLGCIELNPWNSRVNNIKFPDFLIFDLDPKDLSFNDLVKVVIELHKLLDELNCKNYCKTSGKKGIHVYVPLGAKYNFEKVREISKLIGETLVKRLPKFVTMQKDAKNKVYVDYAQNRFGQTTVAPYSIRPVDGAPVSTPLNWDEVNEDLNPKNFTIKNTLQRLNKVGDLWKGVLGKGVDLEKASKELKVIPIRAQAGYKLSRSKGSPLEK